MAKLIRGENDLATLFPEIAKEADGWDPTEVTKGSTKKLPWRCDKGHTWETTPNVRTFQGTGCPYCTCQKAWPGFNDIQTLFPKIAEQAHNFDPSHALPGSGEKKEWLCELGHVYTARIDARCGQNQGCPYCTNKKVLKGFNDLFTKFPEISKEANGWDPGNTIWGTNKKLSWKCNLGHTYEARVDHRTRANSGCPYCANQKVWPGFNDLQTKFPEIAKESHDWDPSQFTVFSSKKVQWKCKDCGHRWKAMISARTGENKTGCPVCAVSGFKTTRPAWFYLMERPGEQQFGITNDLRGRMRTHKKDGWTEIEVTGPYNGHQVEETERLLKQWLKSNHEIVKGKQENWYSKDFEVVSLKELFKLSGVVPLWEERT